MTKSFTMPLFLSESIKAAQQWPSSSSWFTRLSGSKPRNFPFTSHLTTIHKASKLPCRVVKFICAIFHVERDHHLTCYGFHLSTSLTPPYFHQARPMPKKVVVSPPLVTCCALKLTNWLSDLSALVFIMSRFTIMFLKIDFPWEMLLATSTNQLLPDAMNIPQVSTQLVSAREVFGAMLTWQDIHLVKCLQVPLDVPHMFECFATLVTHWCFGHATFQIKWHGAAQRLELGLLQERVQTLRVCTVHLSRSHLHLQFHSTYIPC